MYKIFLAVLLIILNCIHLTVNGQVDSALTNIKSSVPFTPEGYLSSTASSGNFLLSKPGKKIQLWVSDSDHDGVKRAVTNLQHDLEGVTGNTIEIIHRKEDFRKNCVHVIIGSADKGIGFSQLIGEEQRRTFDLEGKWEKFVLQGIRSDISGAGELLVIAGSDKRGTIFGVYDLSSQLGVSPWYWWADVPVKKHSTIYVKPGMHADAPKVQYRGIFINDEAPALSGWAEEKFGGFNHNFYEKVYELILRNKANYLWPAMWGRSLFDDDPQSAELANSYGIVLGTTHHEPLMRSHVEWSRYGTGTWDYQKNKSTLQEFWREGIHRMGDKESIVTVGMRGDGDEPMTQGTAVELLEKIVRDQRSIIARETGQSAAKTPQLFALYKEVQEYYDQGMKVPDDITLLLCDDNWGNLRLLPKQDDIPRKGGYGIYYHFDYVGGPRNYKWINTTQISRVWEQMHLAYTHQVRKLWLVNVGDIKPLEYPISFFLDYAWDPDKMPAASLPKYSTEWAANQFGATMAPEISEILNRYTKYNSRIKPELLSEKTYSLVNFREFETVCKDYITLANKAVKIGRSLPTEYQSAYFQLVQFPVEASANLYELYYAVARNHQYAAQHRLATNHLAGIAKELFKKDSILSRQYHTMNDGKWNHMMSQTHISYTYWQQPPNDTLPTLEYVQAGDSYGMGIQVEGSDAFWPTNAANLRLPELVSYDSSSRYVEIFNRGSVPFSYRIESPDDFLNFSESGSRILDEKRIEVRVNWSKVPTGTNESIFYIHGPEEQRIPVTVPLRKTEEKLTGFAEINGYIAMEAAHYTSKNDTSGRSWLEIPNLGSTGSGMTVMAKEKTKEEEPDPILEYRCYFSDAGQVQIDAIFSPTLNFHQSGGLHYAIAVDDASPVIVNLHKNWTERSWAESVITNRITTTSAHSINSRGYHTVKFWSLDRGTVLQRLIIHRKDLPESFLGPPETYFGSSYLK